MTGSGSGFLLPGGGRSPVLVWNHKGGPPIAGDGALEMSRVREGVVFNIDRGVEPVRDILIAGD